MAVLAEYLWLVWVGAIGAFWFGFATGSNDVANAFGTSVGSKTLTLRQAVLIAAVFEFVGALVLGRVSTSVISGDIAKPEAFLRDPEFYALGMVVALWVGAIWQLLASYLGLNVSATHSIIGAIIGFALAYDGRDAVNWSRRDKGAVPPVKGVVPIIVSWFISPVLTGLASALIFLICRTLVLRREKSWISVLWVLPAAVFATSFINIYFVFTKGAKKTLTKGGKEWKDSKSAWIAAVCAAGLTIFTIFAIIPWLMGKLTKRFDENGELRQDSEAPAEKLPAETEGQEMVPATGFAAFVQKAKKAALHGVDYDIHEIVEEDPVVAAIHKNAEVFDIRAEYAFSYLQVFSAICVIFAHGAGEVGYMSGPLGSIVQIYRTGRFDKKVDPPIWVILVGALGLVFGLALYGYKVTRTMGTMLSKLSPSRGFAAELATALVILLASQYRLPTSSSQCITGGIVGVGLVEGLRGVNWKIFAAQFLSWMATLIMVACVTALIYAMFIFSPSKVSSRVVDQYEDGIMGTTTTIQKNFNATLQSYQTAALAGQIPTLSAEEWKSLNDSLSLSARRVKSLTNPKAPMDYPAEEGLAALLNALSYMQNYSIFTLGQTSVFPGVGLCNTNTSSPANCTMPMLVPKGAPTTFP
uniref:Phosphate transporter n=1 Tax=Coleochaete nitellarum TaxID=78178 RepID=A0A1Q1NHD4_COLNI|nr:sodium/phosphate symporter PTB [Coleochaete nitellarum]